MRLIRRVYIKQDIKDILPLTSDLRPETINLIMTGLMENRLTRNEILSYGQLRLSDDEFNKVVIPVLEKENNNYEL